MNSKIQKLINTPRMSGNTDEEGNFSRGLYQLILENFKPDFTILQIGTYEGVTAELFALMVKKVITIDPYDIGYNFAQESKKDLIRAEKLAKQRLKKYDNVEMLKMTSQSFFTTSLKFKHFDAVYIDGDHTELGIIFDLTHAPDFIRPGGIIAIHDWGDAVIQKAFKTLIGEPDSIYEDGSCAKRLD